MGQSAQSVSQPVHTTLKPARSRALERSRELDHRIANSLQLAADFLMFEYARVRDPVAREALMHASGRLAAVAHLHRFLGRHDAAADVALRPFLTELCDFISESTGLRCSVHVDAVTLPGETAQQVAMAVNELAINAAKHAYPKGEPGALHVVCMRHGSEMRISVSDLGPGLRGFDAEHSGGLGMSIVRAIVRQLRGTLSVRDDDGARFTITFPLPGEHIPARRSFAPRRR
jgi:two-component sensor histidine kinase